MKHPKPMLTFGAVATASVLMAGIVKSDYQPRDRHTMNSYEDCVKTVVDVPSSSILLEWSILSSSPSSKRMMAPEANQVLYTWDFSGFTAGSEENPDSEEIGQLDMMTYAEGEIDSKYTGEEGWTGMGVFQAGGMLYLDPDATGFMMADISTAEISVPEVFTVQVRVRNLKGEETQLHFASVTPNPDDEWFPDMLQTHNPVNGEWKTVNAVFKYQEPHDDLRLMLSVWDAVLVDEIRVIAGEVREESDFTPDDNTDHPEDAEIIVDEDFSLFAEGSIEQPSETSLTTDWLINSEYTHHPGWSGYNVRMAGGCAALVSDYDRCINTFPADLSGHVTVTFRVYGVTEITPIYLILGREPYSQTPAMLDRDVRHVRTNGRWTWVRAEFDNVDGSEDCYIQIHPFQRCFIDDLKVSTQNTLIAQPRLLPATDFTLDGFTANWGKVAKAEDYLLSVYKEQPKVAGETNEYEEGFESFDAALPEGWSVGIEGDLLSDDASEGAKSLLLSTNGDYIELPANGGTTLSLKADILPVGKLDPEYGLFDACLYMKVFDGYKWNDVSGYWRFSNSEWKEFDLSAYAAGAYKVRLEVGNLSEGDALLMDNLRWTTTSETERVYALEDEVVTGNFHVLSGLDPVGDYFYTVKARNNAVGLVSEVTAAQDAFGVCAPEAQDATEISLRGAYTANWSDVPKATAYGVKTYQVYTASIDEDDHSVIEETFAPVTTKATPSNPEMLGNMDLVCLDGLTDNNGWYGFLTIVSEGAMGAMSMPDYGIRGELQSPELSLSNNEGTCRVEIEAWVAQGDQVVLLNQNHDALGLQGAGRFITYYGELSDCTENDILTFYSEQFQNFFIKSIKVSQDLKAGDKVATHITTNQTGAGFMRMTGLDPSLEYGYDVYSVYTRYTKSCVSPASNRVYVPIGELGVERLQEEGVKISHRADLIVVENEMPLDFTVTDISGRMVYNRTLPEGTNEIRLPYSGIFIIKAGEKTAKVMID